MKASMSRMVMSAAVACAVVVPAAALVSPSIAHATPATVCSTEHYNWVGPAPLAAGQSLATGVTVPAQDGTQLEVNAVDVSADRIPADVAVSIGQTPAADGATVSGGEIAAVNTGADALTIMSVSLSIDRCHQVEQDPPVVTTPEATPGTAKATTKKAAVGPLPNTGTPSTAVFFAAVAFTAAGVALCSVGRRRRANA